MSLHPSSAFADEGDKAVGENSGIVRNKRREGSANGVVELGRILDDSGGSTTTRSGRSGYVSASFRLCSTSVKHFLPYPTADAYKRLGQSRESTCEFTTCLLREGMLGNW